MNIIEMVLAFAVRHLLLSIVLFGVAVWLMRLRALGAERRSWLLLGVFALAVAFAVRIVPAGLDDHAAGAGHRTRARRRAAGRRRARG